MMAVLETQLQYPFWGCFKGVGSFCGFAIIVKWYRAQFKFKKYFTVLRNLTVHMACFSRPPGNSSTGIVWKSMGIFKECRPCDFGRINCLSCHERASTNQQRKNWELYAVTKSELGATTLGCIPTYNQTQHKIYDIGSSKHINMDFGKKDCQLVSNLKRM